MTVLDSADQLGRWLGTCNACGLPVWETQRHIRDDGGTPRHWPKCDRPGDPSVVSPEPVPTMTTKGTAVSDDHKNDCICVTCEDRRDDPSFDPGGALSGPPNTDWFCDTAKGIIGGGGQRRQDYGSVEESFENIAKLWSVVLGMDVTAEQVALCQALLKMGRLLNKPNHTDSWVDIIGYAALGGQIAHQPGRHS